MKRNTMKVNNIQIDRKQSHEQSRDIVPGGKLLPEMEGRADARELREFLQTFLSIDDTAVRQRILEEVRLASQENN